MPPNIKFYSDPNLKTPHDGSLSMVDQGTEKEITIHMSNQGNGTLFEPEVKVVRSVDGEPIKGTVINTPPKVWKPGETWTARVKLQAGKSEKFGVRTGYLKVTGKHVD